MRFIALFALSSLGCAPTQGWRHTDQRVCRADEPAIVCRSSQESRHEVRVGDTVLLPGECLRAPTDRVRGRLTTALTLDGEVLGDPAVRVRPGTRAHIEIDGEQLVLIERERCRGSIDSA